MDSVRGMDPTLLSTPDFYENGFSKDSADLGTGSPRGIDHELHDWSELSFDEFLHSMEIDGDVFGEELSLENDPLPFSEEVPENDPPLNAIPFPDDSTELQDDRNMSHRTQQRLRGFTRHFTPQQRARLKAWFASNSGNPYASSDGIKELSEATGLSLKQIRVHLSNLRRRCLRPKNTLRHATSRVSELTLRHQSRCSTGKGGFERKVDTMRTVSESANPPLAAGIAESKIEHCDSVCCQTTRVSAISLKAGPPSISSHTRELEVDVSTHDNTTGDVESTEVPTVLGGYRYYAGSLLDWYFDRLIPPSHLSDPNHPLTVENDTSLGDEICPSIFRDICRESFTKFGNQVPASGGFIGIRWKASNSDDDSKPHEKDLDLGSNAGSARSYDSSASGSSYASFGPRKGRRAHVRLPSAAMDENLGRYRCDECGSRFKTKWLRDRHVSSIHTPKAIWVCGPVSIRGLQARCPICMKVPTDCSHSMPNCWAKHENARTFYRKDGLVQHLRLVHRMSGQPNRQILELLEAKPNTPPPCLECAEISNMITTKVSTPNRVLPRLTHVCWHEFKSHINREAKWYGTHQDTVERFQDCWHRAVAEVLEPIHAPSISEVARLGSSSDDTCSITYAVKMHQGGLRRLDSHLNRPLELIFNTVYNKWTHGDSKQFTKELLFLVVFLRVMIGDNCSELWDIVVQGHGLEVSFTTSQTRQDLLDTMSACVSGDLRLQNLYN